MSAAFLNKRFEHKEKIVNRENCELKAKKADADEPPAPAFLFRAQRARIKRRMPAPLDFRGRTSRRTPFPPHRSARLFPLALLRPPRL